MDFFSLIAGKNMGGGGEKLDHTVTFKVDGQDYYVASCKENGSVSEPPTPKGKMADWKKDGKLVTFPFIPSGNIELTGEFTSTVDVLYTHFSIDKTIYPTIVIQITPSNNYVLLCFIENASQSTSPDRISFSRGKKVAGTCDIADKTDELQVVNAVTNTFTTFEDISNISQNLGKTESDILWCNQQFETTAQFNLLG